MSGASCPSCGGPIEFAIGSSAVVVCRYCRSVVARTDRGPEAHGKVAALIDTGSPLRVGAAGRHRGRGFRITGRTQLRHQAGGLWDEWYAYFDDGRWGWLAEAQGRYYVTFPAEGAQVPRFDELTLGQRVRDLVVSEIGHAEVASAEGELPWRPTPGDSYGYADLTGANREFATIDYSEEPPLFFLGEETTREELGLDDAHGYTRRTVPVAALSCANCGGPLELRAPDHTERIFCPNCGAAHDVTEGKLRYLAALKAGTPIQPVIPLGASGTVDGVSYIVAGFMQRKVRFDVEYFWTEYLLFNEAQGFRWLVHSDEHWSFVTPLRAGEVTDPAPAGAAKYVQYGGKVYPLFQNATAKVTYVLGEFYWKVEAGERVATADYILPPEGISKEVTRGGGAREINYSHARYMTRREVRDAFGVKNLASPYGVGPLQPYRGAKLGVPWLVMASLLLIVAVALGVAQPNRYVMGEVIDFAALPAQEGAPPNGRIAFSQPFTLSGTNNVEIQGSSTLENSWLYVTADLVNVTTGKMQTFELPLELYSGIEDGEAWREDDSQRTVHLSAPDDQGRYVLRFEAQWHEGSAPPPLRVGVWEGVFRWPHFLFALIAISVFPLFSAIGRMRFENERWQDSVFSPPENDGE